MLRLAAPSLGALALVAIFTDPAGAAVPTGRVADDPPRTPGVNPPTPPLAPPVVGVVRDSAGAPLGYVQVVVAGLNRVTTTDEAGRFAFRGLPPGRYHLDAILIGYARADVPARRLLLPLASALRTGRGPRALPSAADLQPATGDIEVPYLAGWQAVELLARHHPGARRIGTITAEPDRITVPPLGIAGGPDGLGA